MKNLFRPRPTATRRILATVLAVTVFGLGLLAFAPRLHAELHADADHLGHSCAITLFAQGVTNALADPILLAVVLAVVATISATSTANLVALSLRRAPARAPPVGRN